MAEGLRVQFYWQIPDVPKVDEVRFAHDSFLQKQDIELGRIRNVMRAANIPLNASQAPSNGLAAAIYDWLDGSNAIQLPYYRNKALERERLSLITRRIGMACLWCGIAIAVFLALFHSVLSNDARSPLIVLMGVLPLIAGIRECYAYKKAEKEQAKQYRFMEKIFSNTSRQLDSTESDLEKRAILKAPGDVAIDEHAEWILMHRERPMEQGEL